MAGNNFVSYSLGFNTSAFQAEFTSCVNIALDWLSGKMHDELCDAIAQCTEAANVMIIDTQKQVKEISRTVSSEVAEIEVGIDEGQVPAGQTYVRVMVTLHGNGTIFSKPGAATWKKHVTSQSMSTATTEYRIPQFDQADHSGQMMSNFNKQIEKHIKVFLNMLADLINAIDFSQFITGG